MKCVYVKYVKYVMYTGDVIKKLAGKGKPCRTNSQCCLSARHLNCAVCNVLGLFAELIRTVIMTLLCSSLPLQVLNTEFAEHDAPAPNASIYRVERPTWKASCESCEHDTHALIHRHTHEHIVKNKNIVKTRRYTAVDSGTFVWI